VFGAVEVQLLQVVSKPAGKARRRSPSRSAVVLVRPYRLALHDIAPSIQRMGFLDVVAVAHIVVHGRSPALLATKAPWALYLWSRSGEGGGWGACGPLALRQARCPSSACLRYAWPGAIAGARPQAGSGNPVGAREPRRDWPVVPGSVLAMKNVMGFWGPAVWPWPERRLSAQGYPMA